MTLAGEPTERLCGSRGGEDPAGSGAPPRRGDSEPGKDAVGADQLLTVTELAAMWGVSKMTVYRLIRSGRAPAVRVGQSYLIPASVAAARDKRPRPRPTG